MKEKAVNELGWKSPIGRDFSDNPNREGKIIGVIKNFHQESLFEKIHPLYLYLNPDEPHLVLLVKISTDNVSSTITSLKAAINNINPNFEFNYRFYDEMFAKQYINEQKLGHVFTTISILAIVIACLGLFGLISLTAEQRTKEIGIRKVLGASMSKIVALLTKDIVKWTFTAIIITIPFAWYGANKWLQNFAYRTEIGLGIFFISGFLILVPVLLSVSWQAIRATKANPIESLRYE